MGYTNIFGGMLYSFTQTFIRTHKDFHAVVVFTLRVVCTALVIKNSNEVEQI